MSATLHGVVALGGNSASDTFGSLSKGVFGVPLNAMGRSILGCKGRRNVILGAKIVRKGKTYEYPWPDEASPNVKGGVLYHLSHFKSLNEKPKPVTLEFEKPLVSLQKKINDVRKMAAETGLDFSDQIISLENKYHQALKDLYTHLTPIQRVNIARHPNRPTFLDHVFNITEKFVELHGDRCGYDDPALVTGIGTIDGRRYMFMGHQKGRNTKENIQRNFGMPTPHGYRKALRMMYYADHHGFPIITFIDTPGAFADLKSEELGQGEAIAHNLRTMFGLKVPIISIVMGEGGSGGALAIGCANKLLMLENAVFYVASPEACAAILWKSAKASPKAAEKLKITAGELCKLQIADGIIPEPLGGAHADSAWTSQQIKKAINETMDELRKMDTEELLKHRMLKFRKIGGFQEGIPIDPKRKVNMKKKEIPIVSRPSNEELEVEVEKLKEQILNVKGSSEQSDSALTSMIDKLQKEVDIEYSQAVKAIGFQDKLVMLREEYVKAKHLKDQPMLPSLKNKIEKLTEELNQSLPEAPNYSTLKYKLDLLKDISKAKSVSEKEKKAASLKQEINEKIKAVLDKQNLTEKIEALKADVVRSGVSSIEDLGDDLRDKIVKTKKDIENELAAGLKSLNLDVQVVNSTLKGLDSQPALTYVKHKVNELTEEITAKIKDIASSSDIRNKIELLKLEIAKAERSRSLEATKKVEALQQQIKQLLLESLSSSELKQKHDNMKADISEVLRYAEGSNGSLNDQYPADVPSLMV
ncbi:unnamed protein product [Rhodiola kirilowii]